MTQKFDIQTLIDNGIQTRVTDDEALVLKYAELLKDGTALPPVTVVSDGVTAWLVDGFHRAKAALVNNETEVEANVIKGDYTEALREALRANAQHGCPRNDGDVQKVLRMAWENLDELFKGKELKGIYPRKEGEKDRPNGLPSAKQLSEITGVSVRSCAYFMKENGSCNLHDSCFGAEDCGDEGVPAPSDDGISDKEVKAKLKVGLDRFGQVIPENLVPIMKSRTVSGFAKMLTTLLGFVTSAGKACDPACKYLNMPHFVDQLKALVRFVNEAKPYCVCPECKGVGCRVCGRNGYLDRVRFAQLPSDNQRLLRLEAKAARM